MERPIRIVLADDHPVVRIGVKNMLLEKDGFEVVGEAVLFQEHVLNPDSNYGVVISEYDTDRG